MTMEKPTWAHEAYKVHIYVWAHNNDLPTTLYGPTGVGHKKLLMVSNGPTSVC
jgi:hypothetical protein